MNGETTAPRTSIDPPDERREADGRIVALTKIMAAKRTTATRRKRSAPKPGKRELLKSRHATFFARRTSRGRFREMDERGRSLTADRRRKAKTRTKSGYGDKGDRRAA